jgi:rifampicin phosphotransferase
MSEQYEPTRVGYKFARLRQMQLAGLPVPKFMCVPVDAFDRMMESHLPGTQDPHEWCAQARVRLLEAAIPADVAEDVASVLSTEFGDEPLFAVRACVVPSEDGTGEDSADDPFAGLSDSFLYVTRDQVADRVAACWASAFTERAVLYRLRLGHDPRRARVAVGIQVMALGTRSFVAFTRDPRDDSRQTVIAAAHGIGTGVVNEEADIDHYFVAGTEIRVEDVRKHRMVGPDGITAVPGHLVDHPVLSLQEIRKIAGMGTQVETLFGSPQDIEGTITADGSIFLVQARPVMRTRERAAPIYWTNHNITESFPGVSSALTYSQAQEFYRRSFGDLYRRLGVPKRRFESRSHYLEQMVGFLDGRVYYRVEAWHALHGLLPIFELIRPGWENTMGITGPARGRPQWTRWQAFRSIPGLMARMMRHSGEIRSFLRWWDDYYEQAGDLSGRAADDLVNFYREMWSLVSVRWGVTLINSIFIRLFADMTNALLRRWAGADRSILPGLLADGRESRSLQAVRAAIGLAEELGTNAEFSSAVSRDRSRQLWDDLEDGRYGARAANAVHDYLRRFCDRSPHDLKLEEATPRQQPWMIFDLIRPYFRAGLTTAENRAGERRAAEEARTRLAARCPQRWRRAVLWVLASGLRKAIRFREDTRFCRSQLYGLSREVMWRLGAQLAESGQLDSADDIIDLTVHEVIGAYDGTLPGSDLRGLAAHRKAERERYQSMPSRHTLIAVEPNMPVAQVLASSTSVRTSPPDGALQGLGSSPGTVRGRARVVLDLSADATQYQGTILIARETDPGWLFLMMVARGLVVERGTLLSHTAITGRLLGIPTVVSVPDATRRIPDGALIEIDGTSGTIQIMED